ncbi:hypothetical protein GPECTOR_805g32 [Gonium pectorale]|uniref:Transmembrane protein 50A n=1 Tax=Gonium pectorale TaxID=33097 RepID=A0A150FV80_GONPE|nr:hypothetical protein GPECTOR_805g32 [Gonium pectorale]|eukprot:KXZ41095.1 hypothetical protein GPECTOR_805g32 [Gonium pectorale]
MGCGFVDWDAVYTAVRPHATFAAGVLFGVAWWVWGDALAHSVAVGGASFSPLSLIPGLVATVAVGLMNCVGRGEVTGEYVDDAEATRARLLLFLSYLVSLGAIGGAITLLVQAAQAGKDMWVGASGVLQCCLVLASGMICWFFHAGEESSLGYAYL